ncbi:hypothetical protein [Stratiformator vulcanicus]|uniref:hypothetical protein n=1 Tax=Stratiformator vulcanicus TaxID=2527980 RepID=UPI0011A6F986|nr:hypothetical protein [Stratiformator vulcanicus]
MFDVSVSVVPIVVAGEVAVAMPVVLVPETVVVEAVPIVPEVVVVISVFVSSVNLAAESVAATAGTIVRSLLILAAEAVHDLLHAAAASVVSTAAIVAIAGEGVTRGDDHSESHSSSSQRFGQPVHDSCPVLGFELFVFPIHREATGLGRCYSRSGNSF